MLALLPDHKIWYLAAGVGSNGDAHPARSRTHTVSCEILVIMALHCYLTATVTTDLAGSRSVTTLSLSRAPSKALRSITSGSSNEL